MAAAPKVETEVAYNGLKALVSLMVRAGAVPDTHTLVEITGVRNKICSIKSGKLSIVVRCGW